MGDINLKYAAKANIDIDLASLSDGIFAQGLAIDNGLANNYIEALVGGFLKTGGTAHVLNSAINFYVAGSADAGTTYSGDASGTKGSYTGRTEQLFLIGQVSIAVTTATTYEFGPFSIAAAFGGILPDMWTIIIENDTGQDLSSTEGDSEVHYMGVEINAA